MRSAKGTPRWARTATRSLRSPSDGDQDPVEETAGRRALGSAFEGRFDAVLLRLELAHAGAEQDVLVALADASLEAVSVEVGIGIKTVELEIGIGVCRAERQAGRQVHGGADADIVIVPVQPVSGDITTGIPQVAEK